MDSLDLVKYLVECTRGDIVEIYLEYACKTSDMEMVKYLVDEKGADVNTLLNDTNETPLHIACQIGCLDLVEYLVENGADIYMENCEGNTPLDLAIDEGSYEVANYLRSK